MTVALVMVEINATEPGRVRALVRATGKEGLIEQRIGAKAVDRVAEAIAR